MDAVITQFKAAVREAVALRGPAAACPPPDATEMTGSCAIRDLLVSPASVGPLPSRIEAFDVVLYGLFRAFLARTGCEAVPALLEDCVLYSSISVPASRLKW
jgi:hypothetical protein